MVVLRVDKNRREIIKKLHTATHIVNYSCKRVLGDHVWQNGSNIREDFATLDITHYKNLTNQDIREIQRIANQIVFSGDELKIEVMSRNKAEQKFGFEIYQGGAIPLKDLRIVKIADKEVEACGGLHVESTRDVDLIRIFNYEKVQEGLLRLYFTVSEFALDKFGEDSDLIESLRSYYKVSKDKIFSTSEKFFQAWKLAEKSKKVLEKEIIQIYKKLISSTDITELDVNYDLDMNSLIEIVSDVRRDISVCGEKFFVSNFTEPKSFKKRIKKGEFEVFIL